MGDCLLRAETFPQGPPGTPPGRRPDRPVAPVVGPGALGPSSDGRGPLRTEAPTLATLPHSLSDDHGPRTTGGPVSHFCQKQNYRRLG